MSAMKRTILFLSVIGLAAGLSTQAQQLRPPLTSEFGQWEAIAFQPRAAQGPLSPDGKWIAYGINRSDRNNELRIANVATGDTAVAPFGDQPAFSADSRWIAYGIALSETEDATRKGRSLHGRRRSRGDLGSFAKPRAARLHEIGRASCRERV